MILNPKSLPHGISPHENGVYMVASRSRPDLKHRVDVIELKCGCERDHCHGNSHRKKLGYLPAEQFCKHLQAALIFDGMVLRAALEKQK